jgi:hypothetical protein
MIKMMSLRAAKRRSNFLVNLEIAHLHCTTPALAGGTRERTIC